MGSCLGFLKKSDSRKSKSVYTLLHQKSFNDDCFEPLLREESQEILNLAFIPKTNSITTTTTCHDGFPEEPTLEGDCNKFNSPVYEMHEGEGDRPLRKACCNCLCEEKCLPPYTILDPGKTWNMVDSYVPSSENDTIAKETNEMHFICSTDSNYSESESNNQDIPQRGLPAKNDLIDNTPSLICFND